MINTLFQIVTAIIIVSLIGIPFVNWYSKARKEIDNELHR